MEEFRIKQVHDRYYVEELKDIQHWFKKPTKEWVDIKLCLFYCDGKVRDYPFKDINIAREYIKFINEEWKRKNEQPIYHYENTDKRPH